jgi:hypothetical protein
MKHESEKETLKNMIQLFKKDEFCKLLILQRKQFKIHVSCFQLKKNLPPGCASVWV